MSPSYVKKLARWSCVALPLWLAVGCVMPMETPSETLVSADEATIAPEVYWVRATATGLERYDWPQRGAAGVWAPTAELDAEWFVGDGWYEYVSEGGWSPAEDLAGLTLDEALQVYDPAPAVP